MTLKTTLPTLAYSPTGFAWSEDIHSSAYTARANPRTDLKNFVPWVEFEAEIHHAITSRMAATNVSADVEYELGPKKPRMKRKLVTNEEGLRAQAEVQLHDPVEDILSALDIEGWFCRPGSGKNQIIGEPDFAWLQEPTLHPKLVIEYKTKWAAPLDDLPEYYGRNDQRNVLEQQSIDALHQIYGYMTFNENKYGILSNMKHAWFLQRVETDDHRGKTLQYYGPVNFEYHSADSPSMLKAFVGIILLAEVASTWFHCSPTSSTLPPGRHLCTSSMATQDRNADIAQAQNHRSIIIEGTYQVLELDPRLCCFHHTSVHHGTRGGCTVRATLVRSRVAGDGLNCFCKIVDLFEATHSIDMLNAEVRNYAMLHNLQGKIIPRVHGYHEVWGLLRVLLLEDVGNPIPPNDPVSTETRKKMKTALRHIHSAGYVHGDIARRNFCMKGNSVFLVDLETLAVGTAPEMALELDEIDAM